MALVGDEGKFVSSKENGECYFGQKGSPGLSVGCDSVSGQHRQRQTRYLQRRPVGQKKRKGEF